MPSIGNDIGLKAGDGGGKTIGSGRIHNQSLAMVVREDANAEGVAICKADIAQTACVQRSREQPQYRG